MSFTISALIVTWGAIALLGLALAGVVRQVRALTMMRSLQLPRIGPRLKTLAPALDGAAQPYPTDRPSVLLFVDAECAGCEEVLPQLVALADAWRDDVAFSAIFHGAPDHSVNGSVQVVANARSAFEAFSIPATPFAVLVSPTATVEASAPIGSPHALTQFVSAHTHHGGES
jgi:hypothetical protein